MNTPTQRRLAAIVSADVVGYSRLMGVDEVRTLAAMRAHRAELIDPKIAEHGGRIVKTMGDGLLLEFPSVVNATACSIEVQEGMAVRNAGVADDKRITLRIGVHVGDIIIEGEDILGDGVNIAARIEALCEPGGVAVSARVHDDVRDRLDVGFTDTGEQMLKNIARPVRIWQWMAETCQSVSDAPRNGAPLPLPDKPSIAVLPFENLSGDPEQNYFAEGIAEDIITAISRIGWLFVIARNSSFALKSETSEASEIGRRLGVRYLLDGSVRKAGPHVRISVRLIEAESGSHLWADRYDGSLEDIFVLQDQITQSVVGAIEPELRTTEIARSGRKPPESIGAYDLLLRALPRIAALTRADLDAAEVLLDKAISLDPTYAQALGYAAWCRAQRPQNGWSSAPADDLRIASEYIDRALRHEHNDPIVLRSAALCTVLSNWDYDTSLDLADKALAIDPNSALTWGTRGYINGYADRREMAINDFDRALRLSPYDSWEYMYANGKAFVLNCDGRPEEGLRLARRAVRLNPKFLGCQRHLIAALFLSGERDEARDLAREHQRQDPTFTVGRWIDASPFRRTPEQERVFQAIRDAGIPN